MVFQPVRRAKFRIRPNGGLYFPGHIVPSEVRLYGEGYFLFEPTKHAHIFSVTIETIRLRVIPFTLPFDIDGDGRLECFEIPELSLDDFVDLEATTGMLDIESGEFAVEWVFQVSPEMVPLLDKPMTLRIPDTGYLNMNTGEFEIHRGMFRVETGPLAGLLVRGSATGCIEGSSLWVTIAMMNASKPCEALLDSPGTFQKDVWACPGDHVVICWRSFTGTCNGTEHDGAVVEPGGHTGLQPNGKLIIEVPRQYVHNPIEYTVKILDKAGNSLVEDVVRVHVYEGEWLSFNAQPDITMMRWCVLVPAEMYSASIEVDSIQLVGNQSGCLDWDYFAVEHISNFTYPGGTTLFATLIDDFTRKSIAPPRPIQGNWCFYALDKLDRHGTIVEPAPNPKDYKTPVCFKLRGSCRT